MERREVITFSKPVYCDIATFMTAVSYNDNNCVEILDHFGALESKSWVAIISFAFKHFGSLFEKNIDFILLKLLLLKRKFHS